MQNPNKPISPLSPSVLLFSTNQPFAERPLALAVLTLYQALKDMSDLIHQVRAQARGLLIQRLPALCSSN